MSPTLNRSSVLGCFEHGNAIKIRNRIMFDFYPGLPHLFLTLSAKTSLFMMTILLFTVDSINPWKKSIICLIMNFIFLFFPAFMQLGSGSRESCTTMFSQWKHKDCSCWRSYAGWCIYCSVPLIRPPFCNFSLSLN